VYGGMELGRASPKWLILYQVGYKTLTQSINQSWYIDGAGNTTRENSSVFSIIECTSGCKQNGLVFHIFYV